MMKFGAVREGWEKVEGKTEDDEKEVEEEEEEEEEEAMV